MGQRNYVVSEVDQAFRNAEVVPPDTPQASKGVTKRQCGVVGCDWSKEASPRQVDLHLRKHRKLCCWCGYTGVTNPLTFRRHTRTCLLSILVVAERFDHALRVLRKLRELRTGVVDDASSHWGQGDIGDVGAGAAGGDADDGEGDPDHAVAFLQLDDEAAQQRDRELIERQERRNDLLGDWSGSGTDEDTDTDSDADNGAAEDRSGAPPSETPRQRATREHRARFKHSRPARLLFEAVVDLTFAQRAAVFKALNALSDEVPEVGQHVPRSGHILERVAIEFWDSFGDHADLKRATFADLHPQLSTLEVRARPLDTVLSEAVADLGDNIVWDADAADLNHPRASFLWRHLTAELALSEGQLPLFPRVFVDAYDRLSFRGGADTGVYVSLVNQKSGRPQPHLWMVAPLPIKGGKAAKDLYRRFLNRLCEHILVPEFKRLLRGFKLKNGATAKVALWGLCCDDVGFRELMGLMGPNGLYSSRHGAHHRDTFAAVRMADTPYLCRDRFVDPSVWTAVEGMSYHRKKKVLSALGLSTVAPAVLDIPFFGESGAYFERTSLCSSHAIWSGLYKRDLLASAVVGLMPVLPAVNDAVTMVTASADGLQRIVELFSTEKATVSACSTARLTSELASHSAVAMLVVFDAALVLAENHPTLVIASVLKPAMAALACLLDFCTLLHPAMPISGTENADVPLSVSRRRGPTVPPTVLQALGSAHAKHELARDLRKRIEQAEKGAAVRAAAGDGGGDDRGDGDEEDESGGSGAGRGGDSIAVSGRTRAAKRRRMTDSASEPSSALPSSSPLSSSTSAAAAAAAAAVSAPSGADTAAPRGRPKLTLADARREEDDARQELTRCQRAALDAFDASGTPPTNPAEMLALATAVRDNMSSGLFPPPPPASRAVPPASAAAAAAAAAGEVAATWVDAVKAVHPEWLAAHVALQAAASAAQVAMGEKPTRNTTNPNLDALAWVVQDTVKAGPTHFSSTDWGEAMNKKVKNSRTNGSDFDVAALAADRRFCASRSSHSGKPEGPVKHLVTCGRPKDEWEVRLPNDELLFPGLPIAWQCKHALLDLVKKEKRERAVGRRTLFPKEVDLERMIASPRVIAGLYLYGRRITLSQRRKSILVLEAKFDGADDSAERRYMLVCRFVDTRAPGRSETAPARLWAVGRELEVMQDAEVGGMPVLKLTGPFVPWLLLGEDSILTPVDVVPVCPKPKFVVHDDKTVSLDADMTEFVVISRVAQLRPAQTRARIVQQDLERVCAAAGTTHGAVQARMVEYLGGVAVE